jgi:hypothetical protein
MGRKKDINDCHIAAKEFKLVCISKKCNGTKDNSIKFKCRNRKHIIKTSLTNIKENKGFCKKCNDEERCKEKLKECHEVAKKHGGECLSTEYKTNGDYLKYKCKIPEHPIWGASYKQIVSLGTWCRHCAGLAPINIGDCYNLAAEMGITCESKECHNTRMPINWHCSNSEHKGFTCSYNALYNHDRFCNECKGYKPLTLDDCIEAAKKHRGKCLSTEYKTADTPMDWECNSKHIFTTKFKLIRTYKTWCPECSNRRSEKMTRHQIQDLMGLKFPSTRKLEFLRYKTGFRLELDGYNEEEKIAFEYQGIQHVIRQPHWQTEDQFKTQQERDIWKKEQCIKNNIDLIEIPHIYNYKVEDDLGDFIEKNLVLIYHRRDIETGILCNDIHNNNFKCLVCNESYTDDNLANIIDIYWPNCCKNEKCKKFYSSK